MASSVHSDAILAWAPLPPKVQDHLLSYKRYHPALAKNPSLTEEAWIQLYGPKTSAVVAESLLWRSRLTPRQVDHALAMRRERRKGPLAALLASGSTVTSTQVASLVGSDLSAQTAELLLGRHDVPAASRNQLATLATPKQALTHLLTDHRSLSDDEALAVMRHLGASNTWKRASWTLLPALLIDRPRLLERLVTEGPVSLLWLGPVVEAGVPAGLQGSFVDSALALPAPGFTARHYVQEALRTLAKRPDVTPAVLERLATYDSSTRILPVGVDLDTEADPAVLDLVIERSTPWVHVRLARNPHLTKDHRKALERRVKPLLTKRANFTSHNPGLLETVQTGVVHDLVPPTRWRNNTVLGDYQSISRRLGSSHRSVAHSGDSRGSWNVSHLAVPAYRNDWILAGASANVADRLGEDLAAWEVALELAGGFRGPASDLAEAALLVCAR